MNQINWTEEEMAAVQRYLRGERGTGVVEANDRDQALAVLQRAVAEMVRGQESKRLEGPVFGGLGLSHLAEWQEYRRELAAYFLKEFCLPEERVDFAQIERLVGKHPALIAQRRHLDALETTAERVSQKVEDLKVVSASHNAVLDQALEVVRSLRPRVAELTKERDALRAWAVKVMEAKRAAMRGEAWTMPDDIDADIAKGAAALGVEA
jgi:hypothetical protein